MTDAAEIVKGFDRLLDEQSAAIRSGDLTALVGTAAQAERLLKAFGALERADAVGLTAVRGKAEVVRGQMTYVMRGIRDARRRVEAVLGMSTTLETYDRAGKSRVIRSGAMQVERRL